jgi:hypothetical protein
MCYIDTKKNDIEQINITTIYSSFNVKLKQSSSYYKNIVHYNYLFYRFF